MVRFQVSDALTEEEIERGLNSVIKDGLASQTMGVFTGGIFLVAFALLLGASNLVIGILAAIPPLTQLVQIPGVYLVERVRNRRAISVYASIFSRTFWILVASIPFLFSPKLGVAILGIGLLFQSIFGAIGGISWNSWMRDLVPEERLGTFFSKRMRYAMSLSIVLSLAAAAFIDYWKKVYPESELYAYSILFFLGFLAGMIGIYFLSTTPEPRMPLVEKRQKFQEIILQPFGDKNFKNLIMFLGSWNFAVNLAAPFFTVYMLQRLELGMSLIIGLTVISQIMHFAFLRVWGKFTDRFSNKSVLGVSGPLFIASILLWTFTTLPEKHVLTIPLLIVIHIFMGTATAGIALASGNIGLKLAPRGQATAYLAAISLVNAVAAGTGPILGGLFADFFAKRELSMTLNWTSPGGNLIIQTLNLQQWDFFFFLAFFIGLYSIHRLAMVDEVGEVDEMIVVTALFSEVRREVRSLTTVAGLRQTFQFPYALLMKNRKKP
ncbi:MFS transporter [archaeon]|nr:MFS transporter [archaeon]